MLGLYNADAEPNPPNARVQGRENVSEPQLFMFYKKPLHTYI